MSFTQNRDRVPETNKKPGVCYAYTDDGLELPVIDVDHAAFKIDPEQEANARPELVKMPSPIVGFLMRPLLRRSILAKCISSARGTYAKGVGTYLMKLGPENLGAGYAKRIDAAIAASLPCLSARIRLRNTARLLARSASEILSSRKASDKLVLCNIAGGPSADSLNALMMLHREHPGLLNGRTIELLLLDLNSDGVSFARHALESLRRDGCPLEGLDITIRDIRYDWNDADSLGHWLGDIDKARDGVVVSSEGGLFEYADDDAILKNLSVVRRLIPNDAAFVGSLGKSGGAERKMHEATGTAVRIQRLESFKARAAAAGWRFKDVIDCPLQYCFVLRPKDSEEATT